MAGADQPALCQTKPLPSRFVAQAKGPIYRPNRLNLANPLLDYPSKKLLF